MKDKWFLTAGMIGGLWLLALLGCDAQQQTTDFGIPTSTAHSATEEEGLSAETTADAPDAKAEPVATQSEAAGDEESATDVSPEFAIFDAMLRQYEGARIPVSENE